MPYASDFIDSKQVTTTAQSTADWDMVDAQIRERAFFMAGVSNARILQEFKEAARDIAAGKLTTNEARKRLRAALREAGYEPAEDERGGIHDLSSRRRMEVTLETNVALARGWMQRQQMLLDKSQPGLRLFRARRVRVPRNWVLRWGEAAARIGWQGVARGGEFVALIDSPIWREISRFGVPYPPFDFGSQMRVKAVPYEECERLGLFDEPGEDDTPADETAPEESAPEQADEGTHPEGTDAAPEASGGIIDPEEAERFRRWLEERARQASPPMLYGEDKPRGVPGQQRQVPELTSEQLDESLDSSQTHRRHKRQESARTSLNDHLETDIDNLDAATRKALEKLMGSLLEVKNGKAQSTDLNGSKPYTPQELADIWKKGIPQWIADKGFKNVQEKALVQWINNSRQFNADGSASPAMRRAMEDLLTRLQSQEATETLYRGMHFDSEEKLNALRENCRAAGNTYTPAPWKTGDSFGTKRNAEKYMRGDNQDKRRTNKYQVLLVLKKHRSGKDLRPLYDAIQTIQQNHGIPMKLEGEVIFMKGSRFRIVELKRTETRTADGKIIRDTYTLEEDE